MLDKVRSWIKEQNLVVQGEGLVVGVSGGADSLALLHVLRQLQEEMALRLLCVHVEHGLRGEDSLSDARFVEEICRQWQVEFRLVSLGASLHEEILDEKTGRESAIEEKARKLRYEALEAEAVRCEKEWSVPVKIAVAHHLDDNVETMLFHLARGTGLDGMCGMPVHRGRIIRPFYILHRAEIEAYLEELGQDYCIDQSNMDCKYDRNLIRHQVVPNLQKINHQATSHMNQTALLLREVNDYLQLQVGQLLGKMKISPQELSVLPWADAPDFLRREVIHAWLGDFIPGMKDVSSKHLADIVDLESKQVGSRLDLPANWMVRRTYDGFRICKKEEGRENGKLGEKNEFPNIVCKVRTYDGEEEFPRNSYTKWFDYDKIKGDIEIRRRRMGDYLTINANGGTKKLQDYLVNEKIPAEQRDDLPLICDGSHVLWVVGYRISEAYKITSATKRILEVQVLEEH